MLVEDIEIDPFVGVLMEMLNEAVMRRIWCSQGCHAVSVVDCVLGSVACGEGRQGKGLRDEGATEVSRY